MKKIVFYILCLLNCPIFSQAGDTAFFNDNELYRFALNDLILSYNSPTRILVHSDDHILDDIRSHFDDKVVIVYGTGLVEAIKKFKNPEIIVIRPIWIENGYFIVNLTFMKCSYKRKKKTLYFQNAGFRRYHFRYDCDKMNFTLAKITDDGA